MTPRRLALGLAMAAALAVAAEGPAVADDTAAASAQATTAAQQLAERYSPVVVIRRYDELCGSEGEPFVPMPVDPLLGNPEVALRQVGNGDPVIRWAPTAKDLYGRGQGVYLDLAGESLQPGCIFASDSARYNRAGHGTVYAHVAQQSGRPNYVAVQYWLYWYYNDWNDKHEGDWEFIQVLLRAKSPEDALKTEPVSVGYAQHTGGEVSEWSSDKLKRDGTHPFVYSSERSHASYVERALFLGRGSTEGFGCDNTQAPSTRLRPDVVLLPDAPSGPDDPFAWLAFQGRWGERQASPNNGPTGPATKPRWTDPVSWQDDLRESSFVVPGGSAAAPPVINTFCSVVGQASVLFINFMASPAKVLGTLAVLVAVLLFLLRRTSWRVVDPLPIVARRRAGEIVRASFGLYRGRPWTFAQLGALAVPVAVLAAVVSEVLERLPFVGPATTVAESGDPGGEALIAATVAAAFWPLTIVLVGSAVTWLLAAEADRRADPPGYEAPRPADALRAVWQRARDLTSSFLLAVLVVVVLSLTVIGVPVAVWLTGRYQFLAQVTMLEGSHGRAVLARSGALTRGRWLHTAIVATLIWAAVQATGLALGLFLLVLFTGLPLWVVSMSVVVCQVALVPIGAIVLTLLYGDARAERSVPRQGREPAVPARA